MKNHDEVLSFLSRHDLDTEFTIRELIRLRTKQLHAYEQSRSQLVRKLDALKQVAGLTRKMFADKLNIHETALSALVNGRRESEEKLASAHALANALLEAAHLALSE